MAAVIEYPRSRFDQTSEPKHYRVVKRKRSREPILEFLSVCCIIKSKRFCSRCGPVGSCKAFVHSVERAPRVTGEPLSVEGFQQCPKDRDRFDSLLQSLSRHSNPSGKLNHVEAVASGM